MIDGALTGQSEFTTVTLDSHGTIVNRATHRVQVIGESLGQGIVLELVVIPGGSFSMGSLAGQGYEDERPQHRVCVPPFLMAKYLVTQEQWRTVMGPHTGRFNGACCPVENVSWKDAARFCERLSKRTGRTYRLPSEAQWEYGCRAGSATAFSCGQTLTTDVANFNGEFTYGAGPKGVYRHVTTEVGSFPPNSLGLYDMHGNVWEWCADVWHDSYEGAPTDGRAWQHGGNASYRVVRGGSWHDTPEVCRSAARLKLNADEGDEFTGFRVVVG